VTQALLLLNLRGAQQVHSGMSTAQTAWHRRTSPEGHVGGAPTFVANCGLDYPMSTLEVLHTVSNTSNQLDLEKTYVRILQRLSVTPTLFLE
jgi:hypothetical protein